jgi:VanZ family protein
MNKLLTDALFALYAYVLLQLLTDTLSESILQTQWRAVSLLRAAVTVVSSSQEQQQQHQPDSSLHIRDALLQHTPLLTALVR